VHGYQVITKDQITMPRMSAAPKPAAKTHKPRSAAKGKANGGRAPANGAVKQSRSVKPTRPSVEIFIAESLRDRNGKRAAIAAGYSAKTADQQASRLLKNVKVRQAVDSHNAEIIEKVKAETGITLERTLREIARIGYFDPRRMFSQDGVPLAITELDDDTAAAVAGLEVLEEFAGSGQDRVKIGTVKKWKLSEKKGALDMLMKHLGGYKADNAQAGEAAAAALTGLAVRFLEPGQA